MNRAQIEENYPKLRAAANELLGLLGPALTGTEERYIETGIATASALAGLSILRGKGFDLSRFTPGSMIFTDIDAEMGAVWDFMIGAGRSMGLNPEGGWDQEIPQGHRPVLSIPEMTQKTEKEFALICARHHLSREFFPYVGVLAALKLIYAAGRMNVLDPAIGKALAGHHIVAGAKTVPYP